MTNPTDPGALAVEQRHRDAAKDWWKGKTGFGGDHLRQLAEAFARFERDRLAALRTAGGQDVGRWQPIETAPFDELILAALRVQNKKGDAWWERHAIVINSETGDVTQDTEAGWQAGDYICWQPLPAPPETFKEDV